jgi:hypothetical protein
MKINFVKTFIPAKYFVAVEKVGNKIIVRFNAVKDTDIDAYSCIEGSVSASEYDEQWVLREYEAWKQKWAEKALTLAKKAKIAEITAYDTSPAVNGFILNGQRVWLDFELRDRVYQGNERLQRIGRTDTTLWLGKQCYNLSIEQAQNIISHIEAYAKDCYNVTAAHKVAVSELTSIEEVEKYDITAGYPAQLKMEV